MWPTFFMPSTLSGARRDTDCWFPVEKVTPTTRVYSDGETLDPELQLVLPAGLYRIIGTLFWNSPSLVGRPAPGFTISAGSTPSVYDCWSFRAGAISSAYPDATLGAVALRVSVGTRSNFNIAQYTLQTSLVVGHQRSHVDVILSVPSETTVGVLWGQVDSTAAGSYTLDAGSWIAVKEFNP